MSQAAPIRKVVTALPGRDTRVCVSYAECKSCNKATRFGVLTKAGFICEKCYGTESKEK